MTGFGFGLERLGLLVLRFPRLFGAALILSLLVFAAGISNVTFDGNILHILTDSSSAFRSYRLVQHDFRDFSGDMAVLVRADGLYTPEKFEELRNFHLDLNLVDGVEGVYSLFSASRLDPQTGQIVSAIPEQVGSGTDVAALVKAAAAKSQLVAQMTNVGKNAALIEIETDLGELGPKGPAPKPVLALMDRIRAAAPPGFKVDFAGFPVMRADAVNALISDQIMLTAVGVALATLIALLIFRSPLPAIMCLAPAIISLVWVLGSFGLTGADVTYLSTTLPTIAMVLALADAVMLFFAWQAKRAEGLVGSAAVAAAVRRTGPANAMTSITTAVAFASFGFSGNASLRSLAMLGSSAVIVAFIAVLVALPLMLLAFGDRVKTVNRKPFFSFMGPWCARFAVSRTGIIATAGIVLTVLCLSGHFFGKVAHQVTDHVPRSSVAARGERLTRELFGGVAPIYVTVPVPDGMQWNDPAALQQLEKAQAAVDWVLGADKAYSLAKLIEGGMSAQKLKQAFADAPAGLAGRFISADKRFYLVTAAVPFGMEPSAVLAMNSGLDRSLAAAGLTGTHVTGYPILSAVEIPDIIRQLKRSLILAIIMGVGVVMLSSRQPLIALAALVPNLLPVLFMETVMWLLGRPMDIPHVIALTIAFGVSIDNAIHIINMYLVHRSEGMAPERAMRGSLEEVAPALVSATLMFVAGSVETLFSALPAVANLGYLITTTLAVALFSNLALLPALILSMERLMARRQRRTGSEEQAVGKEQVG